MCTVTFIPAKDGYFITSNRDEKVKRFQAIPPEFCKINNAGLIFPKDANAGGTWIALKDNSDAAVLLNGAFVCHKPHPPYKRSRGLILLDILAAHDPAACFFSIDLEAIEPFTLILFQDFMLQECRWDGYEKHHKLLSAGQNHIWSSATLYDEVVQRKREAWFAKWLERNKRPSQADIFHFHQFAGDGDEQNDIRMNRDGQLYTVSITGIHLTRQQGIMNYIDFKDGKAYTQKLNPIVRLAV